MIERKLEEMSKEELMRELRKLQTAERRFTSKAGESDRDLLIHDLEVHQVELEMQNRELQEAQGRLEEAMHRYSDLYDFAPVGYCTLDPEGCIQEINLTGAALFGATRIAVLGKPFTAVVRLRDTKRFYAHMKRCVNEKSRVTTELAFSVGPDTRTMQLVSEPVPSRDGSAPAYRTMLVDVSDLKAMEDRLRFLSEAGESLASSLDYKAGFDAAARTAVPVLADLCMIDVQSESGAVERKVVLFADPNKQRALSDRLAKIAVQAGSQTAQASVIASSEPMVLPEVSAELRERISQHSPYADALRAAGVRSLIVVPLTARGRTFGALTLATVESNRRYSSLDLQVAEDLARRIAMAVDNARLYADAQRAIAARDATLALVSHDLRNLLGLILVRVSLMLKRPPETDRRAAARKSMESIRRAAERMNRLIQDLLDAASSEAGRLSIEKHPEPMRPLVAEAIEAFQADAAAKSLRLESDVPPDIPIDVPCDRDRVEQVLVNLLGNAIKFTGPGGTIVVRVTLGASEICIAVSDTGPGIALEDLPHVFNRFWKASKTARMGTGLGLTISKGIVEAHGGRIWVESQVGIGSTFYFTLPVEQPESEVSASPASADDAREPLGVQSARVVLVAEDDANVREVLCATLELAGYEVAAVANGAEALDYLRRKPPPLLVVLDLAMPVVDGWAFLAERNRDSNLRSIPVIVISGQSDIEDKVAAARAGYVPKPISVDRLIETVEQVVH